MAGNEFIRGGYSVVQFTETGSDLYGQLSTAYRTGKPVLLTQFTKAGIAFPDQFVTLNKNEDAFVLTVPGIATISASLDGVDVAEPETGGGGENWINIDSGIVSNSGVSYVDVGSDQEMNYLGSDTLLRKSYNINRYPSSIVFRLTLDANVMTVARGDDGQIYFTTYVSYFDGAPDLFLNAAMYTSTGQLDVYVSQLMRWWRKEFQAGDRLAYYKPSFKWRLDYKEV